MLVIKKNRIQHKIDQFAGDLFFDLETRVDAKTQFHHANLIVAAKRCVSCLHTNNNKVCSIVDRLVKSTTSFTQ